MQRVATLQEAGTAGMEMVGSVPVGIGIRGSVATRSSLAMGFSTVRSAGDSTRRLLRMRRRFISADAIIITSGMISTHGVRGCTIRRACAEVDTATGSAQVMDSTVERPARAVDSAVANLMGAGPMQEVDFMAAGLPEAGEFMAVVAMADK